MVDLSGVGLRRLSWKAKHHRHLQLPLINGADFPEALGQLQPEKWAAWVRRTQKKYHLTVILTHSLLAFSARTLPETRWRSLD